MAYFVVLISEFHLLMLYKRRDELKKLGHHAELSTQPLVETVRALQSDMNRGFDEITKQIETLSEEYEVAKRML